MYVQYVLYVVHTVCMDWHHGHVGMCVSDGIHWPRLVACTDCCFNSLVRQSVNASIASAAGLTSCHSILLTMGDSLHAYSDWIRQQDLCRIAAAQRKEKTL